MAFAEEADKMFSPRKDAAERLEEYVNSLPEKESQAARRILLSGQQKKVMDAFRKEGYPISYITLMNWKEAYGGL